MIRTIVALVRMYLKKPSLAAAHAGKGVDVFKAGGVSALAALVARRIGLSGAELQRKRAETEVRKRLAALPEKQKNNGRNLLTSLLPHAADLTVLDVVHGTEERLLLVQCHILQKYGLLDEDYYKRTHLGDIASIQPADHYMKYGQLSGLKPNAFFDPVEYAAANPDIVEYGMDPIIHYALFGWQEGRSAGSLFDGEFYLSTYPDVEAMGICPLVHFLQSGRKERRRPKQLGGVPAHPSSDQKTIIVVSHDAELGGAQQVVRILARWLQMSTRYDIKLVTMKGGPFSAAFSEIAPTFDVNAHPADQVAERLRAFAGPDVCAVLLNSVASGGFLNHWEDDTPVVAFIHEMPKLLRHYGESLDLIRDRAATVIGGSEAVKMALRDEFDFDEGRLQTVYGFIEPMASGELVALAEKEAVKQELGLDPDALLVTACGVLHWRKSPDKFIEIAERLAAQAGRKVQFVWIGGGPDQEICERMVVEKGLGKTVRFTGYEPDIMRWLNASDVFLLPSEEDPFPLVCLYAAMALNPVVCFEEAGGMPEFVSRGCGAAVPFGDTQAMAAAVADYRDDDERRHREGIAGRALVEDGYTAATTGPQLLHHIRSAAGIKPSVSVIVPNYNYERFLPERLETIKRQTFQDFEVVLLDDVSTDGSVKLLEEWAKQRPGTQLVVNEKNSGSPFAQWLRGMSLAQSDLIWIAEADDASESEFLETLLPCFDDRNVFLSYTKSVPVDENGAVLGDYNDLYLDRIAKGRWNVPYVATDHEEANSGLGIANCIPNASSVVFRNFQPEQDFERMVTAMRMCGDWLFYLRAMRGGLVAYSEHPMNLHRRHGATVTSRTEGSAAYFDEFATIRDYVESHYRLEDLAREKISSFARGDVERFGITDEKKRSDILRTADAPGDKLHPTVLFVASDFAPGGGQLFVIELANAWARHGGRAILLNAEQYPSHEKVAARIDPRVAVFCANGEGVAISELIERFDVDLIHSALWWADRHVQDQLAGTTHMPWVVTMHGCYETLLDNPLTDPSFPSRIDPLLRRVDAWVPTARKNERVFDIHGAPQMRVRIRNGIRSDLRNPRSKQDLGLREEAIVLCLATRAIGEKGWFHALEITRDLNQSGIAVDLMLIGEGPAADEIRKAPPPHVHLFGHVDDLQDHMAAADIGLLPSYFVGESMPLVLLELMLLGKPVVATDLGEIAAMVGTEEDAAGIVVPLVKGKPDVEAFVKAVRSLASAEAREIFGQNAIRRIEAEFTMEKMIAAYEGLYGDLLARVDRARKVA